jgi:aminoglycoside 2'-N-acetyltransferase I
MAPVQIRVVTSDEAPAALLTEVRQVVVDAFDEGAFSEDDWQHSLGGWHVIGSEAGTVVSHAAVVTRVIDVGDDSFAAGYVEGVGTRRDRQRQGLGAQVMTEAADVIRRQFPLGVLSTSSQGFYERLGWERWQGPTFVRVDRKLVRTEEEDDGIMVLRFGPSEAVDLTAPISCTSRSGDDW